MRKLFMALACLIAFPAVAQEAPVYVTRHYDTPAGEKDPDLLAEGKARAGQLSAWFYGRTLKAIYVTDFKRTRQTVAPLAAMLGVTPEVYDPRDTPGLVARAKAAGGPVLIVGHSNTVPDIVEQLGGKRPADLAHPDFGDLWVIDGSTFEHHRIE